MSFLPGEKKKLVDLCKETLGVLGLLQTFLPGFLLKASLVRNPKEEVKKLVISENQYC